MLDKCPPEWYNISNKPLKREGGGEALVQLPEHILQAGRRGGLRGRDPLGGLGSAGGLGFLAGGGGVPIAGEAGAGEGGVVALLAEGVVYGEGGFGVEIVDVGGHIRKELLADGEGGLIEHHDICL